MKVEVHDALIGEVLHPMKFVTFAEHHYEICPKTHFNYLFHHLFI